VGMHETLARRHDLRECLGLDITRLRQANGLAFTLEKMDARILTWDDPTPPGLLKWSLAR
jgi:hypothetical protein